MKAFIYFNLLFLLILFSCVTFSSAIKIKTTATSGPFRSMLTRVQKCNKTTYPLDDDPPILSELEVHNSSSRHFLLRGIINVIRENKQVKLKVRSSVWQNDKWKNAYLINSLGCHTLLLRTILSAVGLKYDRETCGFVKGKIVFSDIDVDSLQHIWTSQMKYGRILWIFEASKGSSTYFCWEFETLVVPLDP